MRGLAPRELWMVNPSPALYHPHRDTSLNEQALKRFKRAGLGRREPLYSSSLPENPRFSVSFLYGEPCGSPTPSLVLVPPGNMQNIMAPLERRLGAAQAARERRVPSMERRRPRKRCHYVLQLVAGAGLGPASGAYGAPRKTFPNPPARNSALSTQV